MGIGGLGSWKEEGREAGGEGARAVELWLGRWVGEGGEEAWGREAERLREGQRVRAEVDLGESSYLCAGKRAPLYRNE